MPEFRFPSGRSHWLVAAMPLATLLASCDPAATAPPASFLLTCVRVGAPTMVLRADTGRGTFVVASGEDTPEARAAGKMTTSTYSYDFDGKSWTGKLNRYDGQLTIMRKPLPSGSSAPRKQTPPPPPPRETWACTKSPDKAKF